MARRGSRRAGRARLVEARTEPVGQAPGIFAERAAPAQRARLDAFVYAADRFEERHGLTSDQACALAHADGVTWINLAGVDDVATVEALCRAFGLHTLAIEDIVHLQQRPKVEIFGDHVFVVAQMVSPLPGETWETEQVSFVLGPGVLLSFQEDDTDVFGPVRDRLRSGAGRLRHRGPDYLLYALLDLLVDSLYTVLEAAGDRTEALEDAVASQAAVSVQLRIAALRREMALLRRAVWPLREVLAALQRDAVPNMTETTQPYLRDVYDHLVQAIDVIESLRDVLSATLDLHLSVISTRQNDIMKTLTVVSTVFIPLTFIVGVYGMNFDNMPELHTRYGYFVLLGSMLAVAGATLGYFRYRRWL